MTDEYIESPTGKTVKVSSKVKVGKRGSPRWRSYCSRSSQIRGNWRGDPNSRNWLQRRRWNCDYEEGEIRASDVKKEEE